MILPSKYLRLEESVLAAGVNVLDQLDRPSQVSTLWERCNQLPAFPTFDRFVLTLDFLYCIGAIDFDNDVLTKAPVQEKQALMFASHDS
jgi:hypothetical protein